MPFNPKLVMKTQINSAKTRRLRVLIFHPALAPYRIDLFNAIAELCNLRLVFLNENLLSQKFDQNVLRKSLTPDFKILTEGFNFLGRSVRWGIKEEISTFDPDVVVTPEFSPTTLVVTIVRRRLKSFGLVALTEDNPIMAKSGSPLRRLARNWVLRNIDGLLVYSEDVKTLYNNLLGFSGPVGVCPILHREESLFTQFSDALPKSDNLAEHHVLYGKKIILYVGRLSPEKRLDRLIDAFSSLVGKDDNTILVIVGDGSLRESLERIVQSHGVMERAIFTGRLEDLDLFAWYNLGSVLVLPSEHEPWGAVTNEALLAGMPVICSDRAGSKVMIEHGVNGSVVNAADVFLLSSEIRRWLNRTPFLAKGNLTKIRKSLMKTKFENTVDGFMNLMTIVSSRHKREGFMFIPDMKT